jgi:hypothetical protein
LVVVRILVVTLLVFWAVTVIGMIDRPTINKIATITVPQTIESDFIIVVLVEEYYIC